MKKLFLTVLFCLIASSVFGLDKYYVNANATGSNNGTSLTNGWTSFSSVNWNLVDTDNATLYVCGTFSGMSSITQIPSGEEGTPFILTGDCVPEGGNPGVIQNSTGDAIDIRGNDWIVVEWLQILTPNGRAVRTASNEHVTIRGLYYTTPSNSSAQTDGIAIYADNDVTASDIIVEYNYLILTNQGGSHNDCIQGNQATNPIVRYNYCENHKDSEAYTDASGIYFTETFSSIKVYGNILYMKQGGQGITNRNLTIGTAQSYFINNTVKCGSYRCVYTSEEDDPVIKNNIGWEYRTPTNLWACQMSNWSGTSSNIEGNLWYSAQVGGYPLYRNTGMSFSTWVSNGMDNNYGKYQLPVLDEWYRPTSPTAPSVGMAEPLADEYMYGLPATINPSSYTTWKSTIQSIGLVNRNTYGGSTWDAGAFEYGAAAPVITLNGDIPTTITSDSLTASGNGSVSSGTINTCKCRINDEPDDTYGTTCPADDETYDSASEDWTCSSLSGFDQGYNVVYCECKDSSSVWSSGNYISVTFDSLAPTVLGDPIINGGTNQITINFSENVDTSGYISGSFDVDCSIAGQNISLSSPQGMEDSITFTLATVVNSGDICDLDYTGGANEIKDSLGNYLATFSGDIVVIQGFDPLLSGSGASGDVSLN